METHLILQKYMQKKRKAAKGFSLRSLAGELDLSPSFLSRVLTGQKPVPYPLLLKLGKVLEIEPEIFSALKSSHKLEIVDETSPKKGKADVQSSFEQWELAAEDSHRILRNWFYLPILDMTSLADFDGTVKMLARRLGLSVAATEVAVRDLISLGLLAIENDRLVKTAKKIRWGSSTSLDEIRRFHTQMLEKAQQELRNSTSDEDFKRRLVTGITLTASPEKIEKAKQKLAECLHEIANELIQEAGTEVYHLSAQLFPLSKGK